MSEFSHSKRKLWYGHSKGSLAGLNEQLSVVGFFFFPRSLAMGRELKDSNVLNV